MTMAATVLQSQTMTVESSFVIEAQDTTKKMPPGLPYVYVQACVNV